MKLICFPYAGATSVFYTKWKNDLNGIKIIPVNLPGRGTRMSEPLCKTIEEMVDDLKKQVLEQVNQEESYAVYGHSMGTVLIYELLHELQEMGMPMPVHIFLSGKNPPHVSSEKTIHQLPDDEFLRQIILMGGMEDEFFKNPMLMKMYLPIMKADFAAIENYHYEKKKNRLPADITYFYAKDDDCLNSRCVKQWANYTSGSFRMYYFTGGHFFIYTKGEQITEIIKETLSDVFESVPY